MGWWDGCESLLVGGLVVGQGLARKGRRKGWLIARLVGKGREFVDLLPGWLAGYLAGWVGRGGRKHCGLTADKQ